MAYFIFGKNQDNVNNTIYRIAENQYDLNNLNINQENYKIIQDSESNFNAVKYRTKQIIKYNQNTITYYDISTSFQKWQDLNEHIAINKIYIKNFLDNNLNHPLYNKWNDYYNQINTLRYDLITFPLNKSLEQYFNDLGQLSLNPLQMP